MTLWQKIWSVIKTGFKFVLNLVLRYPLAAIATTILIVVAIAMVVYGGGVFQIGGLLEKIWGTKPKNKINARVSVVPGRTENGKIIVPGESDPKGYVQAPAETNIKKPGILSNPNKITIEDPVDGEITLDLPVGVKNTDVAEVIIVKPEVKEVKNNDSGVNAKEVLLILKG
jgi:hypothetical protein